MDVNGLADRIAEVTGRRRESMVELVSEFITAIAYGLDRDREVALPGLGSLLVRDSRPRTEGDGRNVPVSFPASITIEFKPHALLQHALHVSDDPRHRHGPSPLVDWKSAA